MDVFNPALEIENAGSLGDCISPASRNKKKQGHPGDIFTPVPLNKRELVSPVDVFSPYRNKI